MKAIVCHEYGDISKLSLEEVDPPQPNDTELLLRILAAGVNFPDGLLVQGLYQAKPETPFIPGMECCCEVLAMGTECTGFQVGDRVILSNTKYGAFAEQLVIDYRSVIPAPTDIPPEQACNLLVAHGTAHHALKQRGQLKAGENLVVLGAAGGTGIAAVQIGKAMGANVIAAASTDKKLALAKEHGADHVFNYTTGNIKDGIREYTNGQGADVIYDPVGGDIFDSSVRAMARNGRYLVIGFASGTIPKFPINLALVKEFSLVGVFWGTFICKEPKVFSENMQQLFKWHKDGLVSVNVDQTFALKDTASALSYVMDRKVKGKVSIVI